MAQVAYVEKRPRCALCSLPSFGGFVAEFSTTEELVFLCAACAFSKAWATWHGHMTKKLKSLRLEVIFKLPPGDPPKPEVPLAQRFVASDYAATFVIDGDRFSAPLGTFATEWAALERARQLSQKVVEDAQRIADGKRETFEQARRAALEARTREAWQKLGEKPAALGWQSHWSIQTGVTRKEEPK